MLQNQIDFLWALHLTAELLSGAAAEMLGRKYFASFSLPLKVALACKTENITFQPFLKKQWSLVKSTEALSYRTRAHRAMEARRCSFAASLQKRTRTHKWTIPHKRATQLLQESTYHLQKMGRVWRAAAPGSLHRRRQGRRVLQTAGTAQSSWSQAVELSPWQGSQWEWERGKGRRWSLLSTCWTGCSTALGERRRQRFDQIAPLRINLLITICTICMSTIHQVGSQIAPILVESYGAEETQVRKAALTCLVSLCLQVRIEMEKNCLLTPRMNTCRWGKTTWLPTLPGFLEQKESCSLSTFTGLTFFCLYCLLLALQLKVWVFTQPHQCHNSSNLVKK